MRIMKKVAVIYTGETRTIETTIKTQKQNVLLNGNYHVFAVVQSDNIEKHNRLIRETMGENLKTLEWFDRNDMEWLNICERQLNKMNIDDFWKNYLRNSGSMIEYYQMYLAYKSLEKYEKENNIKYDYVLRLRTDVIIKDIVNFDVIFEKKYIKICLYKIKFLLNCDTIISQKVLELFMNTFYNDKRLFYDNMNIYNKIKTNCFDKLLEIKNDEEFIDLLFKYLNEGEFIITLRKNLVYFIKRTKMTCINMLGITYGEYINDDYYWFNAESQLENICLNNNIDLFSSSSFLEEKSLYEYDHSKYFNENNELKEDKYSFFIKRQ